MLTLVLFLHKLIFLLMSYNNHHKTFISKYIFLYLNLSRLFYHIFEKNNSFLQKNLLLSLKFEKTINF